MLPQSQRSPRSTFQSPTLDADPSPPPRVPMPHASLAHDWLELAPRNGVGLNRIKQVASHAAIWFDWIRGAESGWAGFYDGGQARS
jgi:hypothetical protein